MMEKSFNKLVNGYKAFKKKYAYGDTSIMQYLSTYGQTPATMVIACCDSRVDPALILQCDPGDLFVVRNVANIVPPFEKDDAHHGTSAALEFGIRFLKVKHLVLLGHTQCAGIQTLLNEQTAQNNDFITNWVSIVKDDECCKHNDADEYAMHSLHKSYNNCMTFPWIKKAVEEGELLIHLWFFDVRHGVIMSYCNKKKAYIPL